MTLSTKSTLDIAGNIESTRIYSVIRSNNPGFEGDDCVLASDLNILVVGGDA